MDQVFDSRWGGPTGTPDATGLRQEPVTIRDGILVVQASGSRSVDREGCGGEQGRHRLTEAKQRRLQPDAHTRSRRRASGAANAAASAGTAIAGGGGAIVVSEPSVGEWDYQLLIKAASGLASAAVTCPAGPGLDRATRPGFIQATIRQGGLDAGHQVDRRGRPTRCSAPSASLRRPSRRRRAVQVLGRVRAGRRADAVDPPDPGTLRSAACCRTPGRRWRRWWC